MHTSIEHIRPQERVVVVLARGRHQMRSQQTTQYLKQLLATATAACQQVDKLTTNMLELSTLGRLDVSSQHLPCHVHTTHLGKRGHHLLDVMASRVLAGQTGRGGSGRLLRSFRCRRRLFSTLLAHRRPGAHLDIARLLVVVTVVFGRTGLESHAAGVLLSATVAEERAVLGVGDVVAAMAHLHAHRAHADALGHAASVAEVPVLVHVLLLADSVGAHLVVQWHVTASNG